MTVRSAAFTWMLAVFVLGGTCGAFVGAWWMDRHTAPDAVVCQLHDGQLVPVAKFIRAHGVFASSTGVCRAREG